MNQDHLLSFLIWLPTVLAILVAVVPADKVASGWGKGLVLFCASLCVVLGTVLLVQFDPQAPGFQFVERSTWIPSLGVEYFLGVDGLSIWSLILIPYIVFLLAFASPAQEFSKSYALAVLVLLTAMLGTLCALDLLLFYVFWELMLLPLFVLLGLHGSKNLRVAFTFVLYTLGASVFMLASIVALGVKTGSFALDTILAECRLSPELEVFIFLGFAVAFAVKIPLFPLHGWLAYAQRAAAPGVTVVIAALLFQMGIYGFFRFALPIFPRSLELCAPSIATLGALGVLYGALVAWRQPDARGIASYSLVSHLGLCVVGLMVTGGTRVDALNATLLHTLNHAISVAALFILLANLERRVDLTSLRSLGGLALQYPRLAVSLFVVTLSLLALPLTNGFVSEFMLFFSVLLTYPALTTIALLGAIIGVVYSLRLFQEIMLGEPRSAQQGGGDIGLAECATVAPLLVLIIALGLWPRLMTSRFEGGVRNLISRIEARKQFLAKPSDSGNPSGRGYRLSTVSLDNSSCRLFSGQDLASLNDCRSEEGVL